MDRIFFENVRCFRARQEARLAPLTVLVGENSSGKSTFLALVRLAWDLASKPVSPDFNEEPFQLGAFDQIVSAIGVQSRRKRTFTVGMGMGFERDGKGLAMEVKGSFGSYRGQPVLEKWSWKSQPYQISVSFAADGGLVTVIAEDPIGEHVTHPPFPVDSLSAVSTSLLLMVSKKVEDSGDRSSQPITAAEWTNFKARLRVQKVVSRLAESENSLGTRPYAFAPVRTKPKRTYDPIQPLEGPEGSHIPMILADSLRGDPEKWRKFTSAIESFGRQSGLFDQLEVRRLGKLDSDPFQIRVRVGGAPRNLLDVGYGVSQVLPIIVDCLRGEEGETFLLQQPEVHLHPSAQAELASFCGVLAKAQKKRFVIETHSDYLVDRIRMDIRDRKGITPEDVSLLYFERQNGEAHIHELALDDQGNILNPPPGCRSFFLEEERRFLGG